MYACVAPGPPTTAPQEVTWEEKCDGPLPPERWRVAQDNWSGDVTTGEPPNGGVVPANLEVHAGRCLLWMRGLKYSGAITGTDGHGFQLADGRLSGAAIATTRTFGSGRYEVRMRVPNRAGFIVGLWTLHYSEVPIDPWFGSRGTIVRNHEIDIEIVHGEEHGTQLWFSTAVGEAADAKTTHRIRVKTLADRFHELAFDWRSGPDARVHFELDGRRMATSRTHVPTLEGRIWLGAWAPRQGVGRPEFDSAAVEIDWVRVREARSPFDERDAEHGEGFLWAPVDDHAALLR